MRLFFVLLAVSLYCTPCVFGAPPPPDFSTKNGTDILRTSSPNLTVSQTSTWQNAQVILQYTLSSINNSVTNTTEILEQFYFIPSGSTNQTQINQQSNKGSADETLLFSPTQIGITGTNQTFTATLSLNTSTATNKTAVNATISMSLLQTQLISASSSTVKDTFPICPKIRYFYVDIPNDGNAYQIILFTDTHNISQIFTGIYLRHGSTPDIQNGQYDYKQTNLTSLQDQDVGGIFNDLTIPGRWWFAFVCRSNNPNPDNNQFNYNWDVTAEVLPTCALECYRLKHGKCVGSPPFCDCFTWWEGTNCEKTFTGVYTLIILACVFGVGLLFCVVWTAYRFHQRRLRKKRNANREKNSASMREHHHHQEHRHKEDVPLLVDREE